MSTPRSQRGASSRAFATTHREGGNKTQLGMPYAPRGVGHLRGTEPFPVAARAALANTQLRRNLGKATSTIRAKRAAVVAELPDWEELRAAGQAIKQHTLAHLDHLSLIHI